MAKRATTDCRAHRGHLDIPANQACPGNQVTTVGPVHQVSRATLGYAKMYRFPTDLPVQWVLSGNRVRMDHLESQGHQELTGLKGRRVIQGRADHLENQV